MLNELQFTSYLLPAIPMFKINHTIMRNLICTMATMIYILSLSSCSDSHDKIMDDQLSWMEDVTKILNQAADGEVSSSDAANKIRVLGKQGDEFMERKKVLNESVSQDQIDEITKKYSKRSIQAFQNYIQAIERLTNSGRMTNEISEAISNINGV